MKTTIEITKRAVWLAFLALVLLAGLSWWLSTLALGPFGVPLALGIAAAKVALVALVFMELGEHRGGVRLAAVTGPAFLMLLLLAMLADVWLR